MFWCHLASFGEFDHINLPTHIEDVTHKVQLRRAQAAIASRMHMQKKRVEVGSPPNHIMMF